MSWLVTPTKKTARSKVAVSVFSDPEGAVSQYMKVNALVIHVPSSLVHVVRNLYLCSTLPGSVYRGLFCNVLLYILTFFFGAIVSMCER